MIYIFTNLFHLQGHRVYCSLEVGHYRNILYIIHFDLLWFQSLRSQPKRPVRWGLCTFFLVFCNMSRCKCWSNQIGLMLYTHLVHVWDSVLCKLGFATYSSLLRLLAPFDFIYFISFWQPDRIYVWWAYVRVQLVTRPQLPRFTREDIVNIC